ncbi:MAG: hypothetical protein QOE14_2108 [Humisphaera sp.]|nr:hypothetical protein [Humisphaera sp.]
MIQTLSILAILLAIGLPLLDFVVFRPRRRTFGRDDVALRGVERLIYLVFLVTLAGMVISSVFMLAIGDHMHRWMLILHMTLAPLWALSITGLALLWTNDSRSNRDVGERVAFCIVVVASFLTITSAMLGMMTWFGSDGQRTLLNLHRISALALLVAAAYQAGRLLARQRSGAV